MWQAKIEDHFLVNESLPWCRGDCMCWLIWISRCYWWLTQLIEDGNIDQGYPGTCKTDIDHCKAREVVRLADCHIQCHSWGRRGGEKENGKCAYEHPSLHYHSIVAMSNVFSVSDLHQRTIEAINVRYNEAYGSHSRSHALEIQCKWGTL